LAGGSDISTVIFSVAGLGYGENIGVSDSLIPTFTQLVTV